MPFAVRIDVTGLRTAEGRFRKAAADTPRLLQEMGEDAGADWQTETERRSPYRTGRLRRSITHTVTRTASGRNVVRVALSVTAPYAEPVIRGSRPHVIVPHRAKLLSWTGPGGRRVFARKVHHPGTRPNDFVTEARKAIHLDQRLRRTAQRVTDVLGGR